MSFDVQDLFFSFYKRGCEYFNFLTVKRRENRSEDFNFLLEKEDFNFLEEDRSEDFNFF